MFLYRLLCTIALNYANQQSQKKFSHTHEVVHSKMAFIVDRTIFVQYGDHFEYRVFLAQYVCRMPPDIKGITADSQESYTL